MRLEEQTREPRPRAGALLESFLSPGQNPTRAAHERFWADDLVYTSSTGKVTNKAQILKSFDEPPQKEPGKTTEPEPVYSAEDVLVRPYGEMAALTFRLVARAADGSAQCPPRITSFAVWNAGTSTLTIRMSTAPGARIAAG